MPRPRFENMEPEKKQRLLTAAMHEFAAHGYELASINRILEAAGFSKGSFYYYFDDKADLAITVMDRVTRVAIEGFELLAVDSAEEFWAELRRQTMHQLALLESRRLEFNAMTRIANAFTTKPDLVARLPGLMLEYQGKLIRFFEQGRQLGALRTDLPTPALMGMIQAVKTSLYASLFPGDRVPDAAELEAFSDRILELARRICSP